MDLADRPVLRDRRLALVNHDGARDPVSRDGARRSSAHTDNAGRPAVHFAAWRSVHQSRMARAHGPESRVGPRALACIWGFRVPLRVSETKVPLVHASRREKTDKSRLDLNRRKTMKTTSRHVKLLISTSVVAMALGTGTAFAGMDEARKWIDAEFQPSTLSKDEQAKEMEWFVNAAKPFAGMEINVVSETITTHEYEAKTLAKAF